MKKEITSFFTNDKIYSFIDRRTTAEEDNLFVARMAKDKDFADMIEDLMDATSFINESNRMERENSIDYSQTAIAAFCDNIETIENRGNDTITDLLANRESQNIVDDFLNSLEEDNPDNK